MILTSNDSIAMFEKYGGGKAKNLAILSQLGLNVPDWFCVPSTAMQDLDSEEFKKTLMSELERLGLLKEFVAVRSSGIGEDGKECSFAGIHESYLFQKGWEAIYESIKKCLSSCQTERAKEYREQQGLQLEDPQMAVVIQRMINSESSGVAFSRNPVNIFGDQVVINSVWGIGEGLVNGDIEGDLFTIDRKSLKVDQGIVEKKKIVVQSATGGTESQPLEKKRQKVASLSPPQVEELTKLVMRLEEHFELPQDFEWAFTDGTLYCLQARPITTLPPSLFFEQQDSAILWDNSNIIESYSGVTTPLTFSFANACYEEVYRQFCKVIAVPDRTIEEYDAVFRNMLGIIRGQIYYNLVNWYRLAMFLPGASSNEEFMETMMGVKHSFPPSLSESLGFTSEPPKISLVSRLKVYGVFIWRFIRIEKITENFHKVFNSVYLKQNIQEFKKCSINELKERYEELNNSLLKRWQAPIINDCFCMIFFGLLKNLTARWVKSEDPSLQNDLLCGEGGIESAEPTKMLMRIAERIDLGDAEFRKWFLETPSEEIFADLSNRSKEVFAQLEKFIDLYGFRCVNELKLESKDLHDSPAFVIDALVSYVRMKSYSLEEMEKRERAIRDRAESIAFSSLKGPKKWLYRFILKNARSAIKRRENMRFARTKIFGVVRYIFRGIGAHFEKLGILDQEEDIFYLTIEEIYAFIEGRAIETDLLSIVERRRKEFEGYKKGAAAPDRMVTFGPACFSALDEKLFFNPDPVIEEDLGPNMLRGTPCSPGVLEGVVRVVKELNEARNLNGEILVTERTDPGWVPLYPSCSGLLIERGSLLSHSAIVARELGLPTIVGISGGLMQKLKTGMRVRVNATKGLIEILE